MKYQSRRKMERMESVALRISGLHVYVCVCVKEEARHMLGNTNKWMINALTLISNIAIFHRCHWNKGFSNIALLTSFSIIETLAPSCALQLAIHQATSAFRRADSLRRRKTFSGREANLLSHLSTTEVLNCLFGSVITYVSISLFPPLCKPPSSVLNAPFTPSY